MGGNIFLCNSGRHSASIQRREDNTSTDTIFETFQIYMLVSRSAVKCTVKISNFENGMLSKVRPAIPLSNLLVGNRHVEIRWDHQTLRTFVKWTSEVHVGDSGSDGERDGDEESAKKTGFARLGKGNMIIYNAGVVRREFDGQNAVATSLGCRVR